MFGCCRCVKRWPCSTGWSVVVVGVSRDGLALPGGVCLVVVGVSRDGLVLPGGVCLVVVGVSRDGLVLPDGMCWSLYLHIHLPVTRPHTLV